MRIIPSNKLEMFFIEMTKNGKGITGLSMQISIKRDVDELWWDGGIFKDSETLLSMTEKDSTKLKGLYTYNGLTLTSIHAGDIFHVRYYCSSAQHGIDQMETVCVEI